MNSILYCGSCRTSTVVLGGVTAVQGRAREFRVGGVEYNFSNHNRHDLYAYAGRLYLRYRTRVKINSLLVCVKDKDCFYFLVGSPQEDRDIHADSF